MGKRTVIIVEYDPQWPAQFEALRAVIANALRELALRIEHIGSTSIPGLAAKPIIDIDTVIASAELLPDVIHALGGLGYSHQGERGVPTRESFARAGSDVPRDGSGRNWPPHHLYVCAEGSREIVRQTAFRDYLRAHPEQAAAYEALKRDLARRFPDDPEAYCDAKSDFVEGVLRRALPAQSPFL